MFSVKQRPELVEQLKSRRFDLLIIGGGITGAGLALQAAASGLSTALVEMQDFSEGTSSRSTKLVHGGIRYLKNFDVEVVSDTVGERAVIQKVAPHIPKADPMILPIYDEPGSTFDLFSVKVAMDLYDHLAGIKGGPYANYMLTKEEVLEREPQLKQEGLLGGGVYLDYRNNDSRLVIENIKQAVADGAVAVSRLKVTKIRHDENGKANGVEVKDLYQDQSFEISADFVANTSGPWSDLVLETDQQIDHTPHMRPTKGVHLVVDGTKLQVPQPTYFDTGKEDGRMVFVIPRESKTYFGTTDTDYTGDFTHPKVDQSDVDYLLEIVNARYPDANLTLEDIEASWVGLRPLISDNAGSDYNGAKSGKINDESFERIIDAVKGYLDQEISRQTVERTIQNIQTASGDSKDNPSAVSRGSDLTVASDGLLTLSGGKLTDYRLMALGAMEKLKTLYADQGKELKVIDSAKYSVSGGKFDPEKVDEELEALRKKGIDKGLSEKDARYIADLYGSNAPAVFEKIEEPVFDGLTHGESLALRYALEEEMIMTPVDYLLRRSNYLLFIYEELDRIKQPIVDAMADFLGWDQQEKQQHMETLEAQIAETQLRDLKN
ncbi:alpha-glycerophosphate oxidase [Enterococcus florum]|uniref:Alpha-glycerophosphate oxidase n=1 Tax=Enterococcus florum TaxID=2480627 RepID=A0A4P5P5C2_9ENTE|nr:type 1 glycerol-3-phosphate oxidase [Enterococcus florum]GCF93037.1 alpha-glycerophosphate oxidase [Enterococcus florum]